MPLVQGRGDAADGALAAQAARRLLGGAQTKGQRATTATPARPWGMSVSVGRVRVRRRRTPERAGACVSALWRTPLPPRPPPGRGRAAPPPRDLSQRPGAPCGRDVGTAGGCCRPRRRPWPPTATTRRRRASGTCGQPPGLVRPPPRRMWNARLGGRQPHRGRPAAHPSLGWHRRRRGLVAAAGASSTKTQSGASRAPPVRARGRTCGGVPPKVRHAL